MESKRLEPPADEPKNKGGRPRGSPNVITADVRAMIRGALTELGGQKYLVQQGKKNPKAFLSLVARICPQEIAASVNFGGKVNVYLPSNGREIKR